MRQAPDNLSGFPNPAWGVLPSSRRAKWALAVGGPQGQSKCWHSRKSLSEVMLPPTQCSPQLWRRFHGDKERQVSWPNHQRQPGGHCPIWYHQAGEPLGSFFFNFMLGCSWFTMLCQFQVDSKWFSYTQTYICSFSNAFPIEPLSFGKPASETMEPNLISLISVHAATCG